MTMSVKRRQLMTRAWRSARHGCCRGWRGRRIRRRRDVSWHLERRARKILVPWFKKATGADVTLTIQLATEQVAKLTASTGEAAVRRGDHGRGPVARRPAARACRQISGRQVGQLQVLYPMFQDEWGPKISMQVIGIGYNPKKIKTPPKSWDDLWNPIYKGRVGLTALNSTLGMAFMAEIARLKGGSESNLEPAFKALKTLVAERRRDLRQSRRPRDAVSAGADRHRAVQLQLRRDPEGQGRRRRIRRARQRAASAWRTSLHIVKQCRPARSRLQYIDGAIMPEMQARREQVALRHHSDAHQGCR